MAGAESSDPLHYLSSLGSATTSTAFARTGTYSFRCNNAQYGLTGTSGTNMTSMGFSFGLLFDSWTVGDSPAIFQTQIGLSQYLRVNASRNLVWAKIDSGGALGAALWTGSTVLAVQTWYMISIETYRRFSDDLWPMRVKLYSNAYALLEDSDWIYEVLPSTSFPSFTSVYFGPGLNSAFNVGPNVAHFDDMVMVRHGAGHGGSGPPLAKILKVAPTGDSATHNAWTALGAGSKFSEVDEVVADDNTTYVHAGSNLKQTFTRAVTGLASTENILAVSVLWRVRSHTAGDTRVAQGALYTAGGIFSQSGAAFVTDSYVSRIFTTAFLAGVPWTVNDGGDNDVDLVQFGVSTGTGGTGSARNTQSLMEVAYGPEWRDDELPRVGWFGFNNSVGGTVSAPALGLTMTDDGQSWPTDMLSGARLKINSGTGSGQTRYITLNTATVVTISVAWVTAPDSTSKYSIHMDGVVLGASTTTTLSDTLKAWRVGQLKGMNLRRPDAAAAGDRERAIASNTATVITVSPAWTNAPIATEVYEIFATARNAVS